VFAEYGFGFYPDDYDSDLRAIQDVYLRPGGMFRFLLVERAAVGTVAVKPLTGKECELKRLYLLAAHRGAGLGGLLLDEAVTWAREHEQESIIAWSDTRFTDAHRAYETRGFECFATRPEPGPDPAEEYGYRLNLNP
jgi:GNAT superfamily N-acetyltransferase